MSSASELIIGSIIGCIASVIGVIASHFLSLYSQNKQYMLNIRLLKEQKTVEEEYTNDQKRKLIRETIMDPTIIERRKALNKALRGGDDVAIDTNMPIQVHNVKLACFTGTMSVMTGENNTKPLSECVSGDVLRTVSLQDKTYGTTAIMEMRKAQVDHYILINRIIEVTGNHLVYLDCFKTIRVSDLKLGDYIYNGNKELIKVMSLEIVVGSFDVYCPVVETCDPIIIAGVLASDFVGKAMR